MPTRGLVATLLVLGALSPLPFAVLADEELQVEVIEIVEEIAAPEEPEETPPPEEPEADPAPVEESAPPELIEVVEEPEEGMEFASMSSLEDEGEPELIWGCEMMYDGDGNEFEQCGMGYYRTLCHYEEGEEVCITFFEFYEEEPDYRQQAIDELLFYDRLALSLSWNGTPLEGEPVSLPAGRTGTLGWSYELQSDEEFDQQYALFGSPEDVLFDSAFTLQVYEGPITEATLVLSESIGTATSGEVALSLPTEGEYRVVLVATTEDVMYPGGMCGGGLCASLHSTIEAFTLFMEQGAACYSSEDDVPEYCGQLGEHLPVAFGVCEIQAETHVDEPVVDPPESTEEEAVTNPNDKTEEKEDEEDSGSSGGSVRIVTKSVTEIEAQPVLAMASVVPSPQELVLTENLPQEISDDDLSVIFPTETAAVNEPVPLEAFDSRPRLTASAIDAVDEGFFSKIGDALYNLWQALLVFMANLDGEKSRPY